MVVLDGEEADWEDAVEASDDITEEESGATEEEMEEELQSSFEPSDAEDENILGGDIEEEEDDEDNDDDDIDEEEDDDEEPGEEDYSDYTEDNYESLPSDDPEMDIELRIDTGAADFRRQRTRDTGRSAAVAELFASPYAHMPEMQRLNLDLASRAMRMNEIQTSTTPRPTERSYFEASLRPEHNLTDSLLSRAQTRQRMLDNSFQLGAPAPNPASAAEENPSLTSDQPSNIYQRIYQLCSSTGTGQEERNLEHEDLNRGMTFLLGGVSNRGGRGHGFRRNQEITALSFQDMLAELLETRRFNRLDTAERPRDGFQLIPIGGHQQHTNQRADNASASNNASGVSRDRYTRLFDALAPPAQRNTQSQSSNRPSVSAVPSDSRQEESKEAGSEANTQTHTEETKEQLQTRPDIQAAERITEDITSAEPTVSRSENNPSKAEVLQQPQGNSSQTQAVATRPAEDLSISNPQLAQLLTELGLPLDFLSKNNIDPVFFQELPEDLKMDIVLQYTSNATRPAQGTAQATISSTNTVAGQDQPSQQQNNQSNRNNTQGDVPTSGEDRGIQQQGATESSGTPAQNTQAMDNAAFIASLAPSVREEVLLDATQEFIATLPEIQRAEAEVIRQRRNMSRMFGGETAQLNLATTNNLIRDNIPEEQRDKDKATKSKKPTKNIRAEIREAATKEKHILSRVFQADEKFIETVLSFIYLDASSFGQYPFTLLKAICNHPIVELKVLDSLMVILRTPNAPKVTKDELEAFPPQVLYEKEGLQKNYEIVYNTISVRILFLLEHISRDNYHFMLQESEQRGISMDIEEEKNQKAPGKESKKSKKSLSSLIQLKGSQHKEYTPFADLIALFNLNLFQTSDTHTHILIKLLYNLTRHIANSLKSTDTELGSDMEQDVFGNNELLKGKVDGSSIKTLCSSLSNESIREPALKKLAYIICILCMSKQNLGLFVEQLRSIIHSISLSTNKLIDEKLQYLKSHWEKLQTNGAMLKKSPSLAVEGTKSQTKDNKAEDEQAKLLSKLDLQIEAEIKLHKIFKIIREIFERSLQEASRLAKRGRKAQEAKEATPQAKKGQTSSPVSKDAQMADAENKAREYVKRSFNSLLFDETLNELWISITEFLNTLHEICAGNWSLVNPVAHKLQPVVESYFIIHKILNEDKSHEASKKSKLGKPTRKNVPAVAISQLATEEQEKGASLIDKPTSYFKENKIKLDPDQMFALMSEKNRQIINMMVKQNPRILSDSLSVIISKRPTILDFDNKRAFFRSELKKLKQGHYGSISTSSSITSS